MAAPAPAPEPYIPLSSLPQLAEIASLLGQLFGSASLLVLLGLNAWFSKKKNTLWIPGNFLVLGALSLQLLGLVSQPIVHISDQHELDTHSLETQFYTIADNQFLITSGRVVMCVFMGNLLPDVARSRKGKVWSNMLALTISATSVLVHLSYESYIIGVKYWMQDYPFDYAVDNAVLLYMLSNIIIFSSIVFLFLLLCCAALASKSIEEDAAHRIPVLLSRSEYQNTRSEDRWEAVERQAVQSWLMARTYQPQYIIARSALSSSICFFVTICVAFSFAYFLSGWITIHSFVIRGDGLQWLHGIVLCVQWIFILLGWAIVSWRWLIAVVFYPKRMGEKALTLKQYFRVEEFWKNAMLDLQEEFTESEEFTELEVDSVLKRYMLYFVKKLRLYKFLHIVLHLQILLILMSKTCWLISEMVFSNHYMRRLLMGSLANEFFMLNVDGSASDEFNKHKEAIMHMPGENPAGVWIASLKSVQNLKAQLVTGESDGKDSKSLISLLQQIPASCQRKLDVGNSSSKMTAVSLLTIIIELSTFYQEYGRLPPTKCIEACSESWKIMELVDSLDPKAALVNKYANKVFFGLKKPLEKLGYCWLDCVLPINHSNATTFRKKSGCSWLDRALPIDQSHTKTFEAAKQALGTLKEIANQKANEGKNWKEKIVGKSLFEVCERIQNQSNNMPEMLDVIESSLAGVIGSCMFKVEEIIMDGCNSWAETFMEQKIWDAFYEAGRAKGVIQELQQRSNLEGV